MDSLVLSLFPGAGLLDRGFEQAGFVVVRGPDTVFGQDIRGFKIFPGPFTGIVGGPPCQDFSRGRLRPPKGYGAQMLAEFRRLITEGQPDWWLMENVPTVPDMIIAGYVTQRFNLFASEFGCRQRRNRSFQFGSRDGVKLVLMRTQSQQRIQPAVLATEAKGKRHWFAKKETRRGFADACELQGLPRKFNLPGLSRTAKYRAVGNGVPVPMARAVAEAIRDRGVTEARLCLCDCGRPVTGKQVMATAACRKRMQRLRAELSHELPEIHTGTVTLPRKVTPRKVTARY